MEYFHADLGCLSSAGPGAAEFRAISPTT